MTPRLTFLGAARTVTGSKYLIEHAGRRLLVDCGLFQGPKGLRLLNWEPLPVPAASIDAVVLTHAHLDHSGYLPRLINQGFAGRIYCSKATADLCGLLLPDSGYLQEEDAEYANRHGFSKHHPALPLYTAEEARRALGRFAVRPMNETFDVAHGIQARFTNAGHLLGACTVSIDVGSRKIVFSGDVGRPNDALMRAPAPIPAADFLVLESTYGDRTHADTDPRLALGETIRQTAARGGVVVIPAFAVGRTQLLLHYLHVLKRDGAIPALLPVYLNSPMAISATELYLRHRSEHRLDASECKGLSRVAKFVNSADESRQLNAQRFPMIIIAASGMATGGRVLHHLKAFAPDPRNTLIFGGFQAPGTRGADIVAGAPSVKIHGAAVPIRAEVVVLEGMSAHADGDQLVAWLGHSAARPRHTFVTHGEPAAAEAMRQRLASELEWDASVPALGETVDLG